MSSKPNSIKIAAYHRDFIVKHIPHYLSEDLLEKLKNSTEEDLHFLSCQMAEHEINEIIEHLYLHSQMHDNTSIRQEAKEIAEILKDYSFCPFEFSAENSE